MSWKRSSGRNFQFATSCTPRKVGPGSYDLEANISQSLNKNQSSCFKTKTKREVFIKSNTGTPAPGSYEAEKITNKSRSSSSFASKTTRNVFQASENPDPTAHSNLTEWGKVKPHKVQIQTRSNPISPESLSHEIIGYKISDDGKLIPVKKTYHGVEWVGPGSYDPELPTSNKGHSMKYSSQVDFFSINENPGPGTYSPKDLTSNKGRKSAIGSRYKEKNVQPPMSGELSCTEWVTKTGRSQSSSFRSKSKRELFKVGETTPSPTEYASRHQKCPKKSIAFGQRSPRFRDVSNDIPGPGAYEPKDSSWIRHGGPTTPRAIFRYQAETDVPGPGSYDDTSDIHYFSTKLTITHNSRKIRPTSAFASKSPRDNLNSSEQNIPGPGQYNIDRNSTGRSPTIHRARNTAFNNFLSTPTRDVPAPNEYQTIQSDFSKGRTISSSPRFLDDPNSNDPGPGTYNTGHASFIKKSYNVDFVNIDKND